MLIAVSIVIASITFLIYQHPPQTWPLFTKLLHPSGAPSRRVREGQASESPTRNSARLSKDLDHGNDEEVRIEKQPALNRFSAVGSPEATPKVRHIDTNASVPIPEFALDPSQTSDAKEEEEEEEEEDDDDDDDDDGPPPSFPALNSAQRASGGELIVRSTGPKGFAGQSSASASQLMPPPPRIPPISRSKQSAASSLRIPPSGPTPNRQSLLASGSLGLESVVVKKDTSNARNKVALQPGHSSLDWANLLKSGKNLSGVTSLIRVTPSMLKYNNGRKGKPAWSAWQGRVYNITPFLPYHPGGEGELMRAAGKNGEKLFMEVHPWVSWENMLGECLVGIMVGDNEPVASKEDQLDQLD